MADLPTLSGPYRPPSSGGKPRKLVILLHGVGANGDDLIGLAPYWAQALPEAEFLAPNAPYPCDMAPFGYQWFSLLDRSPGPMLAGIRAAAPILDGYIDEADENVYRYYVERDFAAGQLSFGFVAGSWEDQAGNEGVAGTALIQVIEALAAPRAFDPGSARLEVAIACNFYERVTVIPELVQVLRVRAPGIKLNIISSTVRGKEQLRRGESDMLIGPIEIAEAGYFRRALMRDDYVCILDPGNPLAAGGLDRAAFAAAPQVVVNYGGNFRSRFLLEMEAAGMAPNAVMEVPSPANLPVLIVGTDMLATVPRRTAASFGAAVAVVPCPFPGSFGIDLYWTARTHVSAPHVWIRSQLAAAAGRIAG